MYNGMAEFLPLLSNSNLKNKTVRDLQVLGDDSIRKFCLMHDFGSEKARPTT